MDIGSSRDVAPTAANDLDPFSGIKASLDILDSRKWQPHMDADVVTGRTPPKARKSPYTKTLNDRQQVSFRLRTNIPHLALKLQKMPAILAL
jgi:hypothetical protein